tara:strand:- start:63 stop:707 length:645 start_codon:yes stop_codon:yes gene_type:complete
MSTLTVGTIAEKVTDAGVAVDGVTLKDGGATFTSAVGVTGNTTITSGNLVIGTSGNGIDFSAVSGSASGSSSALLDDYEEGTFTPAADFASASPSAGATVGQGVYTKIGRLVNIQARLVNINVTGSSGDIKITGLPFTSLADSGDGSVTLFSGTCKMGSVNVASGSYCVSEIIDNVNHARVMECTDNVGTDVLNTANFDHGASDLHLNLTYPVQ